MVVISNCVYKDHLILIYCNFSNNSIVPISPQVFYIQHGCHNFLINSFYAQIFNENKASLCFFLPKQDAILITARAICRMTLRSIWEFREYHGDSTSWLSTGLLPQEQSQASNYFVFWQPGQWNIWVTFDYFAPSLFDLILTIAAKLFCYFGL